METTWLLDTTTFERRRTSEGLGTQSYAVFFYCWAEDDIGFHDMLDLDSLSQKPGFLTLQKICSKACEINVQYIWVDRLCIDPSSASELSESICSLFRWYQNASACYVLLDDIKVERDLSNLQTQIRECKWFTRCWVLQELLAPKELWFYDREWEHIGSKTTLLSTLSSITQIDQAALESSDTIPSFSVGRRMSWASRLSSARLEDTAYSLLGIFGVRMDIIYGEGGLAFLRLQERIMEDTVDASALAWKSLDSQRFRGILAYSPAEFAHFTTLSPSTRLRFQKPIQLTSAGIITQAGPGNHSDNGAAILCLLMESPTEDGCIGYEILLQEWNGRYLRYAPQLLPTLHELPSCETRNICLIRDIAPGTSEIVGPVSPPVLTPRDDSRVLAKDPSTGLQLLSKPLPNRKRSADGHLFTDTVASSRSFNPGSQKKPSRYTFRKAGDSGTINVMVSIGDKSVLLGKLVPTGAVPACQREEESTTFTPGNEAPKSGWINTTGPKLDYDSSSDSSGSGEHDMSLFKIPEVRRLDPDHRFSQLAIEAVKSGLERCVTWITQGFATGYTVQERASPRTTKRLKTESFEAHIGVYETTDSDDDDAVNIQILGAPGKYFACPFYLRNNQSNQSCLSRASLSTAKDVTRHIWGSHRRPDYCPRCSEIFSTVAARDSHIKTRICSLGEKPVYEGVSRYQMSQLTRKQNNSWSDESRWNHIWDILFPTESRPDMPYLSGKVESAVCAVRRYWSCEGQQFVRDFLESKQISSSELHEERESMAAMQMSILDGMIDEILEVFKQEDEKPKSSCALNLLAALRESGVTRRDS